MCGVCIFSLPFNAGDYPSFCCNYLWCWLMTLCGLVMLKVLRCDSYPICSLHWNKKNSLLRTYRYKTVGSLGRFDIREGIIHDAVSISLCMEHAHILRIPERRKQKVPLRFYHLEVRPTAHLSKYPYFLNNKKHGDWEEKSIISQERSRLKFHRALHTRLEMRSQENLHGCKNHRGYWACSNQSSPGCDHDLCSRAKRCVPSSLAFLIASLSLRFAWVDMHRKKLQKPPRWRST